MSTGTKRPVRVSWARWIAAGLLACALHTVSVAAPNHAGRAFVTSTTGSGNLGSWADLGGGGLTGLAAGDRICQIRAHAAGLHGPENFRAWLSSDTTDAYCHVIDGSGKKQDGCGLSNKPAQIGPWSSVDGRLIIADLDDALSNGVVYRAFDRDEHGAALPGPYTMVWTGSNYFGERNNTWGTCSGWTASTGNGATGRALHTTGTWTFGEAWGCSTARHLICMTVGGGNDAVEPREGDGALAFVTSVTGNGNLSGWADADGRVGVEAGDRICQKRATAGGLPLPTSFKAFLSSGAGHAAIDRFTHDGPRYRLDGVRIAENLADLGDGAPLTSLNLDEYGQYRYFTHSVWTGSDTYGEPTADHCNAWTNASDAFDGTVGNATAANQYWTSQTYADCNNDLYALYCVADASESQLTRIFADGMETTTH